MAEDKAAPEQPKESKGLHWPGWMTAAVPALVSLAAAVYSANSASVANERAESLERFKLDRESRFQVYDRVENQLSKGAPANLVMASAYVELIEDVEIKQALCKTINSIAFEHLDRDPPHPDRERFANALREVARVAQECSEGINVGRALPAAGGDGGPGGSQGTNAAAVQARATSEAPTVFTSGGDNPTGWDVDVFWCQGQGERSREAATAATRFLAGASRSDMRIGGQSLGRVRLRSLSPAAQQRLLPAAGNLIAGTADEAPFAQALAAELNDHVPGAGLRYARTPTATRWYVSIFTCGFAAGA
jgi:hypothetical protein